MLPPDIKYAIILLPILTPGREVLYSIFYHQWKPTETVTIMLLINAGALLDSEFLSTFVQGIPLGPPRKRSQMVLFMDLHNPFVLTCSIL